MAVETSHARGWSATVLQLLVGRLADTHTQQRTLTEHTSSDISSRVRERVSSPHRGTARMSAVAPVKLKIRGPTGDVVLSAGLSKASTFSQLQAVIADKCAVPAEQQQCKETHAHHSHGTAVACL